MRRLPLVHAALFLATAATTFLSGGAAFSAALLGILLSHEMGHYLMARAYRVDATLPFFIPGPPAPVGVGTFGAVIRIRSPMPSRRAVLDIGAAGPIAGFAAAVPLLVWGLAHSEVKPIVDLVHPSNMGALGLLRAWLHGEQVLHGSIEIFGDSALTWLVQRLVVGAVPGGYDVYLHPVAFAAWIGLLVTTLNLIPIGQLDGGHVSYALLGRRGAHLSSRLVSWGLFLCGLFLSWSWLVWWLLTRFVVGLRHPPALLEEPLGPGRRVVALVSFLLFAITFIPVPVSV